MANVWFGYVLLAVVGGVVLYLRATASSRKHLASMKRDPPMLTGAAVHGSAGRFCGVVEPNPERELLAAPLSGRLCAYYQIEIREEKTGSGGRSHWETVYEEARGIPFWLRDASGRICMNPQDGEVLLDVDTTEGSGTFDNPTPREAALLARTGRHAINGLGGNVGFKYTEGVLESGELVVACGTVQEFDTTPAQVSRYRQGERNLWLMATEAKALMLTDHAKMIRVSKNAVARGPRR